MCDYGLDMKRFQLLLALSAALLTLNFVSARLAREAYVSLFEWTASWEPDYTKQKKWGYKTAEYLYMAGRPMYIGIKYSIPLAVGLLVGIPLTRRKDKTA